MNAFLRYTIHFMIVSFLILIVVSILGFFNDLSFNREVITVVFLGVIFFSISMSVVFGEFLVKQKEISISYKSEEEKNDIIKEIRRIAIEKCEKKEVKNDSSKYVFVGKSKYTQWLTNPIEVRVESETIIIITPRGYSNFIKKINCK